MSGFAAVAAAFADRFGDPVASAEMMAELFDTAHRPKVFDELCRRHGVTADPGLIERMVRTYRAHAPQIRLHADADAAIDRIGQRCRLGLISDGPLVMQEAKVSALSIRSRIELVILTDRWGRAYWKPHPRAFEHAQLHFDVPPSACAYVADNPAKDFIAPRSLGWRTVQVDRPDGVYGKLAPVPGGAPHHRISSLDELDRLIE